MNKKKRKRSRRAGRKEKGRLGERLEGVTFEMEV